MENQDTTNFEKKQTNEKNTTLTIYAFFIIILGIQVLPSMSLQISSIILLFVLAVSLKFMRGDSRKGTLTHNHATYLSRTLWCWSTLIGIGALVLSTYMQANYNVEQLMTIIDSLIKMDLKAPEIHKVAMMGLWCFIPSFIYLIPRVIRGAFYAIKGEQLPNPKTWI